MKYSDIDGSLKLFEVNNFEHTKAHLKLIVFRTFAWKIWTLLMCILTQFLHIEVAYNNDGRRFAYITRASISSLNISCWMCVFIKSLCPIIVDKLNQPCRETSKFYRICNNIMLFLHLYYKFWPYIIVSYIFCDPLISNFTNKRFLCSDLSHAHRNIDFIKIVYP